MALIKCHECGSQISTTAKTCPHCGAKPKTSTGLGTWLVLFLLLIAFGSAFVESGKSPSAPAGPSIADLTAQAMGSVSLKSMRWKKGGFDNVMLLTATIENRGDRAVKDIEITCTHEAKSGTTIDRNRRTLFDFVPAKGSVPIKDFNMGVIHSQAARSGCEITGLKLA